MKPGALVLAASFAFLLPAQFQDAPFPAHKIAGNLYYVGSEKLASFLVATPEGHILINSSFEETVPLIRRSIEALGFRFADVRILLNSHAHADHAAGNALVKELTGARLFVMQGDEAVTAAGVKAAPDHPYRWPPCKVDRVLRDGDQVRLGKATLTARRTPGHTKGCTTFVAPVAEGGKTLTAVIVGSPNVNPGYILVDNREYPEIARDYELGFEVLRSLRCDLFLGAHGAFYGLEPKYRKLSSSGGANPFLDSTGYVAYVADREAAFRAELKLQRENARQNK
ncbi:MAG: subclass B3 metallo-beta-lactamase [Acidobacteria bacterium]|nr:subclass B3 metallo-beta-lactamase [Acidobacteriota bacterium]